MPSSYEYALRIKMEIKIKRNRKKKRKKAARMAPSHVGCVRSRGLLRSPAMINDNNVNNNEVPSSARVCRPNPYLWRPERECTCNRERFDAQQKIKRRILHARLQSCSQISVRPSECKCNCKRVWLWEWNVTDVYPMSGEVRWFTEIRIYNYTSCGYLLLYIFVLLL